MNYITTTELRTKTAKMIQALKEGESIDLIYRSNIVGEIKPKKNVKTQIITDGKKFVKDLKAVFGKHRSLSYEERDNLYRDAMEAKHGKFIS